MKGNCRKVIIEDQSSFEAFVERASTSPVLAVDTEFLRDRTYYAQLCLLQMATEDEVVLVDPLQVKDLHPLVPLLENEQVVKLFHAGTQDIEILYRELGCVPRPVFDTQIAAALLGQTQQVGYGALVQSVCGVHLKKADSYTDWSRRPLSESQQRYAAEDVVYLPRMYHAMKDELEEKGRLSWLADDFEHLVDPARFAVDPRERFQHLKRVSQLTPRQLSAAREVAAWREETAQRRNIPRKWVITDEQIVEACKRGARSIDELYMVRGLESGLGCADARQIVKRITRGLDAPEETWPRLSKAGKNESNVDVEVDLYAALARLRAREANVAFQTLASRDDLVSIARGYDEGIELLRGWRREIAGEDLIALREGRRALCIKDGKLAIVEADVRNLTAAEAE